MLHCVLSLYRKSQCKFYKLRLLRHPRERSSPRCHARWACPPVHVNFLAGREQAPCMVRKGPVSLSVIYNGLQLRLLRSFPFQLKSKPLQLRQMPQMRSPGFGMMRDNSSSFLLRPSLLHPACRHAHWQSRIQPDWPALLPIPEV